MTSRKITTNRTTLRRGCNKPFHFHFHFVAFNYYKFFRHQDVRRQGSQPSLWLILINALPEGSHILIVCDLEKDKSLTLHMLPNSVGLCRVKGRLWHGSHQCDFLNQRRMCGHDYCIQLQTKEGYLLLQS